MYDTYGFDLYATDSTSGTVKRLDFPNGIASAVASNQSDPVGLAEDRYNVYWTNASSGEIMQLSKTSTVPMAIATGQSTPWSVAVDATNVYWANAGDKTIKQMPVGGGTITTLDTYQNGTSAPVIAVDSSYVYYAVQGLGVYQVPIGGGSRTEIGSIGTNTNIVLGNLLNHYAAFLGDNRLQGNVWAEVIDQYSPHNPASMGASSQPGYVGLTGTDLYWTDNVANGKVWVTDTNNSGTSYPAVDLGVHPTALVVNALFIVFATTQGSVYAVERL